MKRSYLTSLGIEDKEIIDKIMAEYGKSVETHKSEIENYKSQISELNTTMDDLKKNNLNNESLQKLIDEQKASLKAKDLEIKTSQIKGALDKAGATDVDYLVYKLGNVEEFDLKNLDNKIKELQENNVSHFKVAEPNEPPQKVVGNKLPAGEPSPDPMSDIEKAFVQGLNGQIN